MSTEVEQELEEVSLFDNTDTTNDDLARESAPTEEEAPEFKMPEKFQGKSIESVVESYLNVEKALGNKSNEVGELRKLTDQILLNQTVAPQHSAEPTNINDEDVGFNDFVDDPRNAVNRVLDTNPRIQKLERELEASTLKQARKVMLETHPDADELVTSPQFQTWVKESAGRQRMLQEAHVNRDVALASDLFDMFKTTRKVAIENATDERDAIAKSTLKKATVEKGTVQSKTKKVYKRTELIQLKITDPKRYEAMSTEINQAYIDGRVK
jgi:hypothetical protein